VHLQYPHFNECSVVVGLSVSSLHLWQSDERVHDSVNEFNGHVATTVRQHQLRMMPKFNLTQ
jgi:hypothetical protein